MQVIVERCCGLDVHQETVVACLLIGLTGARPSKEVRTFGTMTQDLEALCDWRKAAGVTHVGMESTGVYWRPVYAVLEGHFDLIVASAIRALVQPERVRSTARARSTSPRSRDPARAINAARCSSLAATGDLPPMRHPNQC